MKDYHGGKPIYIYRHAHDGQMRIIPCRLSLMSISDFDEAIRLHKKVSMDLGPEVFVPTSHEELAMLLGGKGVSIGVWHEDRLISMRAVQTDGEWVNESLVKMGLLPDPQMKTAVTDHCVVDKEYRGNNIQFLSGYEMESIVAEKFSVIATTVAPTNIFSLKNVLLCNFHIVGLDLHYGGYLRYTMLKRFGAEESIWTDAHRAIPISDIKEQQRAIAEGMAGYKLKRIPAGFAVFYAPWSINPTTTAEGG
ncbi:MAG: hypothetical protein LBF92_00685 [Synergistaceae bacterium]|jgi:hypothetical protein|nr:hypothetical protein [Synergistaceae bacterium]